MQTKGVFLRTAAAETYETVNMVAMYIFDSDLGHISYLAAHEHFVNFVSARAQNRSTGCQNTADLLDVEMDGPILHEAAKTVHNPDDRHVVFVNSGFGDGANSRIETRTIAT
ncbi:MAG: hypothetical protein P8Z79_06705 [Sedimentisphaerales bacterium]